MPHDQKVPNMQTPNCADVPGGTASAPASTAQPMPEVREPATHTEEEKTDNAYHDTMHVDLNAIDEVTVPTSRRIARAKGKNGELLSSTQDTTIKNPDYLTSSDDYGNEHRSGTQAAVPSAPAPPRKGLLGVIDYTKLLFGFVVPYGGLLSCTFNLASATVGGGIISLPSAFNLSGIIMASVYLVLTSIATIFSMHLLAKVYLSTHLRTYSEAARYLLGPGVDYFLAGLMIVLCFGGSVAYVIATGTLLQPVLSYPGLPTFFTTKVGNHVMTFLVWLVLMLPLVIPKRINSLRYFSSVGVIFIVYLTGCMVYHSATHGLMDPIIRKELVLMRTGNAALEGLGIFMFGLMCQMNAFEIFREAKHQTVFHLTLYSALSVTACAILYLLSGLFGYMDFGKRVTDSVLSLYDPIHDIYIAVAYVGLIVKICVAFALHMIPFRNAIYHFLHWNAASVPYWKHALVMTVPTTAALLCGLFIPKINTVLGLLGSFCGGTIGLIMPALFFMYSGSFSLRQVGWASYLGTYLLLIGGVVAVVFGTATTVYSTAMSSF